MTISEFELIKKYFLSKFYSPTLVAIGVGDDAAVINTSPNEQLVVSVDTLNLGVHFSEDMPAFDVGYKALAVNLSDMAAMGARPKWFTLALSLPEVDETWIEQFSQGMLSLAQQYDVALVGGDTTRGPLSITIQIAGSVPVEKALTRAGAKPGDAIYVTGTLGDAAAALAIIKNELCLDMENRECLEKRLYRPTPRVETGLALSSIASACIDISDGLAADLGHVLEASGVGAEINREDLPLSTGLQQLEKKQQITFALHGGDDYELCFTAPASASTKIEALGDRLDCAITCIGKIIPEPGLYQVANGKRVAVAAKGFDHFN